MLSTCKRRKVGCVIFPPDFSEVLAIGYNGVPRGVDNGTCANFEGHRTCAHAEANALVRLKVDRGPLWLHSTSSPCIECSHLIMNTGLIEIVTYDELFRCAMGVNILKRSDIWIASVAALFTGEAEIDYDTVRERYKVSRGIV